MALSDRERAILEFERTWWCEDGRMRKQEAIRERLGMSPARYYRLLSRIVDSNEALAQDPLVVRRLRRSREVRMRTRLGGPPAHRSTDPPAHRGTRQRPSP